MTALRWFSPFVLLSLFVVSNTTVDAITIAERIMARIDNRWPTKPFSKIMTNSAGER